MGKRRATRSDSHDIEINVPRIKRECLRCNRKFLAEGKFNRVCFPCKGLEIFKYELQECKVVITRRGR